MHYAIEKQWDGNDCETQGANGRTYLSAGRWQWVLIVNGQTEGAYDRRRDAKHRGEQIAAAVAREAAKNPAAVALGRLGGVVTSDRKAAAARANGAKGGRPRKVQA